MKKIIAWTAALLLLVTSAFSAAAETSKPLNIVCTTFPLYDWTRQVLGESHPGIQLTLLQQSGIDLHSFRPSAKDFLTLNNSDLLIYVGGHSDFWVQDALDGGKGQGPKPLNLMAALGDAVKAEQPLEGMQADEHDHDDHDHDGHDHDDHDHDDHDDHGHDDHNHADEHIWLSLQNAQRLLPVIQQAVTALHPAGAATYAANTQAYLAQLKELDQAYEALIKGKDKPSLLFGDRYPFRYLMDDYGITAYAAFAGCSAETEASFQTVAFLADKVDELKLKAVLTLDGSDGRIAQAIVRASQGRDAQVLQLHAMQSVTMRDIEAGTNYLDIMRDNLKALAAAL